MRRREILEKEGEKGETIQETKLPSKVGKDLS